MMTCLSALIGADRKVKLDVEDLLTRQVLNLNETTASVAGARFFLE